MPQFRRLFRFPWRTTLQIDTDLDAEVQFHLDMRTEELVDQGMAPGAAREEARRGFGDVEETRRYCRSLDQRLERQTAWWMRLDEFGQDLRYSLRGLVKSRTFTAVAVLSLAVGIGVNTAVFAVVDAMVLRPFSYGDLDRIVTLTRLNRWNYFGNPPVTDLTWMRRAKVFDAVAFRGFARNVHVASDGHPTEALRGWSASANLFETFGVQPVLGRLFRPEDASLASPDVVILSHDLWQRRFGGSPAVIGETLWLDRKAATIVGVLPSEFSYGTVDASFWVPARLTPVADDERTIQIIARLAPGRLTRMTAQM